MSGNAKSAKSGKKSAPTVNAGNGNNKPGNSKTITHFHITGTNLFIFFGEYFCQPVCII